MSGSFLQCALLLRRVGSRPSYSAVLLSLYWQWNGLEAGRCGHGPSSFGKKDVHYAPETRFSQDNRKKAGQQQNQEQHNNHALKRSIRRTFSQ